MKKAVKLLLIAIVLVLGAVSTGLPSRIFGSSPGRSQAVCPSSVAGIEGELTSSYAYVDDWGRAVRRECPFSMDNWHAVVWHIKDAYGNRPSLLSEYFVYVNGREIPANQAEINGQLVIFDTDGTPYTSEMCGELFHPDDLTIKKWGRTVWQQQCLNVMIAKYLQ